jgi:transposase-like protein
LASINRWRTQFSKEKNTGSSKENLESTLKIKALEKALKETALERDILKKAVSIFSKSGQIRYHFIKKYRNVFPVEKMCSCIRVSKNAYYT